MKKIISFLVLFAALFSKLYGAGIETTQAHPATFKTVIVNADVTIMLVDSRDARFQVLGNQALNNLVKFKMSNDTLVIDVSKNKDLRDAGIIYLPVEGLRKIQINSKALIRSLDVLKVKSLDIIINGDCEFRLSHNGGVHIIGTNDCMVEQSVEKRSRHLSFYKL